MSYIPALPYNYVSRTEINTLQHLLTEKIETFVGITGPSGVGKSTLAKGIGRLKAIEDFFRGGIFWLEQDSSTTGFNSDGNQLLISFQKKLWETILPEDKANQYKPQSWQSGMLLLKEAVKTHFEYERGLIILENLTEEQIYFLEGLSVHPNVSFLITTRQMGILIGQGIKMEAIVDLNTMKEVDGLQLLAQWTENGDREILPEISRKIAAKLEYHPVGLSIVGAMKAGNSLFYMEEAITWRDIWDILEEGELE